MLTSGGIEKVLYMIGLYVSFLFSGIYEEKLYKNEYLDEETGKTFKFKYSILAIMFNSILGYLFSSVMLIAL